MFETLERPPEEPIDRRWPIMFYGVYCLIGLVSFSGNLSRHRFSQPAILAVAAIMFFLSLTFLVSALRSPSPLGTRKLRVTLILLLLLMFCLQYLHM
jgi:hypothetical protein